MSWVIYFFGSGAAFFAGVALVIASAVVFRWYRRKWSVRAATVLVLLGLILIALSATPLPYWFYTVAGVVTLLWLVLERVDRESVVGARRGLALLVVALWSGGAVAEVPYQIEPTLWPVDHPNIYIFADSVTAGVGDDGTETWPRLLARTYPVGGVHDYSQMGATVRTMLRKAEGKERDAGVVLLEIGGNDLLGSTTAADFERDLDALLYRLCGPEWQTLMFELPLPPFRNEFGRVQRRLAEKHKVGLFPKRVLLDVLTADLGTTDSIHLTPQGHQLMADTVWRLLQNSAPDW
jgi:acyl-CoA thioesterase I